MSNAVGEGGEPLEHRISMRKISREALNTKKALNKIYSFDLKKKKQKSRHRSTKRSSSSLVALVPKFSGCSPGGINATL